MRSRMQDKKPEACISVASFQIVVKRALPEYVVSSVYGENQKVVNMLQYAPYL